MQTKKKNKTPKREKKNRKHARINQYVVAQLPMHQCLDQHKLEKRELAYMNRAHTLRGRGGICIKVDCLFFIYLFFFFKPISILLFLLLVLFFWLFVIGDIISVRI